MESASNISRMSLAIEGVKKELASGLSLRCFFSSKHVATRRVNNKVTNLMQKCHHRDNVGLIFVS